jgi:RNA polymerase sigma-70 factor (ECF subfamily)
VSDPGGDQEIAAAVRAEHARVVGALVRRFRDVDLAEEATGEAVVAAVETWRRDGVPPNPGGWLTTTAVRRALDRLRREQARPAKEREAQRMGATDTLPLGVVDDDRLRLLFMCCHPALAPDVRVVLTLRLVAGLSMPEIGRALLTPERTVAQRITRAKRKIAATNLAFRIPARQDLPARVAAVRTVVYLLFNEGHTGSTSAVRDDLATEAIRLGRMLVELLPDDPEAQGLLALMLLTHARREARWSGESMVLLADQDRARWDRALIEEGLGIVRALLRRGEPGPLQIQAAIQAVHTDAPHAADTDWRQVVALYDQLMAIAPSPVVALNRAVALAEVAGPETALLELDLRPLPAYHPWRLARGHLLAQLERAEEAETELRAALELTSNPAEQSEILRRLSAL